jgi:hypothetical protein
MLVLSCWSGVFCEFKLRCSWVLSLAPWFRVGVSPWCRLWFSQINWTSSS